MSEKAFEIFTITVVVVAASMGYTLAMLGAPPPYFIAMLAGAVIVRLLKVKGDD